MAANNSRRYIIFRGLWPLLLVTVFLMQGCSTSVPAYDRPLASPLGLYRTNSAEKYWLAILAQENYLICDATRCDSGKYERVAVDYGVILVDFYATEIGMAIEKRIHGMNKSTEFVEAMRLIRQELERPNDLVINLRQCGDLICAGIGHSREGIKFYRIESFDDYWK